MKTPHRDETLDARLATAVPAAACGGVFQSADLENPKRFARRIPRALRISGLRPEQTRELWEWRSHARRVGRDPLGLFLWLLKHPDRARAMVSAEDERDAGLALARAQRHARRPPRMSREFFRLRRAKARAAKFTCQGCGWRSRVDLRVSVVRQPVETLDDLELLCSSCHDRRHPAGFPAELEQLAAEVAK